MKTLRLLFIIGFGISIVLFFVPYKRVNPTRTDRLEGMVTGRAPIEGVVSPIEELRHDPAAALFGAILLSVYIAFFVLAIVYPKRWVFLAGAIYMSFSLLLALFVSPSENEHVFLIPNILSILSTILGLSGYFVKPEKAKSPVP